MIKKQFEWLFIIFFLFFVIYGGIPIEYSKENLKGLALDKKNKLEDSTIYYQKRLYNLEKEIIYTIDKKEYIYLQINHLTKHNMQVPEILEVTQKELNKKIDGHLSEKDQLKGVISDHIERLKELHEQVKKTFPDSYTEWWQLKPEIKKIIDSIDTPKIKDENVKIKHENKSVKSSSSSEELRGKIRKKGLSEWVSVRKEGDKTIALKSSLPILFASGSANIPNSYKDFIKKFGGFLATYPVKVKVYGFMEKPKDKWDLGFKRASNVANEIVKYGVPTSSVSVISMGDNLFSKNDSMKRRVEVLAFVKEGAKELPPKKVYKEKKHSNVTSKQQSIPKPKIDHEAEPDKTVSHGEVKPKEEVAPKEEHKVESHANEKHEEVKPKAPKPETHSKESNKVESHKIETHTPEKH
ncbi:MAG: OmpA family protein [Desulfobacterales bacterium]|nr:OmpA family protein [Desulfobacterales bacterium]